MIWLKVLKCVLFAVPIMGLQRKMPYDLSSAIDFIEKGSSRFGFSITYEQPSKRLIVSAPLKSISGEVLSCDVETKRCIDVKKNLNIEENLQYNQTSWFGAVVKSAPAYFATCAPLHLVHNHGKDRTGVYSECFKCKTLTSENATCDSITTKVRTKTVNINFENYFLTYGWSIDTFENNIIMGGPAMAKGKVFNYFNENMKGPVSEDATVKSKIKFNFGYSVSIGYFYNNSITYAISSTYGYGTVVFMDSVSKPTLVYRETLPKGADEYLVGSMYGSTLCAASLTGDLNKNTDLLVGAPTYATKHENNVGAVYVYLKHHNLIPAYKRTIKGFQSNSFFGSAIANVKDLNNDNVDEIVIGAPYENNGKGAVYIYSGAMIVNAEPLNYLQRLEPEIDWISFGASLTALEDYDDNGCNELAIGAPETGVVRLLRCAASITVDLAPKYPNFKSQSNESKFEDKTGKHYVYESCFNVTYPEKPKNITATIIVKTDITHPDAKLLIPEGELSISNAYKVVIRKENTRYCRNITIFLPVKGNYNMQIKIKTTASLQEEKESKFDVSHVILSDRSSVTHDYSLWAKECVGKDKCRPNIQYINTTYSVESPYLIGSTPDISVSLHLKNTGEIAYDSCVIVKTQGAPVQRIPQYCDYIVPNLSIMKCSPKQVLRTNTTWSISGIVLDADLTNENKQIIVSGDVYNFCNEQLDLFFQKKLQLITDRAQHVYIGATVSVDNMQSVEHNYVITNRGTTNWARAYLKITVEKLPIYTIDNVFLQVGDNTEYQFYENENSEYECNTQIEKITRKSSVPVILKFKSEQIGTISIGEPYTINSKLRVDFDGNIKEKSLNSKLRAIPLWILIAAVLLGTIIFGIIFYIVKEAGCLRRKKKEQLKRVRMSVRRQTVLRKSQRMSSPRVSGANKENAEKLRNELEKLNAKRVDRRIEVNE